MSPSEIVKACFSITQAPWNEMAMVSGLSRSDKRQRYMGLLSPSPRINHPLMFFSLKYWMISSVG